MKTIIDAVNYYGGYNFVSGKHEKHHTHIVGSAGTNRIYSAYASDIGGDSAICTISEYNQRIYDYKTNFGRMPLGLLELWQVGIKNKPEYTQAMRDKKELPPIGSEYLDEDGQLCKALLHYSCFVLGEMTEHIQIQQYPVFSTARNDRIKPLAPLIELIDGKAYQFNIDCTNTIKTVGIYDKSSGLFIMQDHKTHKSYCTNIQPLTVEIK